MTRFSFVLAIFTVLSAGRASAQDAARDTARAAAAPAPEQQALLVPVEPEPAPVIIVVELEEAPAAEPPIVEPAPAPIVAPAPALEPEEPEPDVFSPGPFSIGLSGMIGTREDPRDGLAPTWTGGLDLALSIAPWARVAIRRVGYSQAQTLAGDRHAISISPAFELATFVHERIEPYVQLGAAMQVRFGEQDRAFGLAPFLDAGLRFYPAEWISISAEGALHVPVTSSFLLGHEILPQGAFALQGGLAVAFHL